MLRSVEQTIHLADDFEERAQPFDELSLSGVFLSNGVETLLERVGFPLRRREIAQIEEKGRGAIIAGGVAPFDFVVDPAPCMFAARGHGGQAPFVCLRVRRLALLAFRLRRSFGGAFAGLGDLGGAGAQFPDGPRFGRRDALALGDALANAPAQQGADERIANIKSREKVHALRL